MNNQIDLTYKEKVFKKEFEVLRSHGAKEIGSGTPDVLSTPMICAYMENTAMNQLNLPRGFTTVGIFLKVSHQKPTKIGKKVQVVSTVEKIDGKVIEYKIEAFCQDQLIGSCSHKRVMVNSIKFMGKI